MTLGNQTNKMYSMIQQGQAGLMQQPMLQHQKIQAKPERSTVVVNNDMLRCKRKINFQHMQTYNGAPVHHMQPASVARRNARERNRVKQVNNGFATLRQHIPPSVAAALSSPQAQSTRSGSKKLSKVETLRMAVEYIRSLQQMIQEHEDQNTPPPQMLQSPPIKSELDQLSPASVKSEMSRIQQRPCIIKTENAYYQNQDLSPYTESPESVSQHYVIVQQTPPCSESSASPTPSFVSESSISTPSTNSYTPLTVYQPESYENYEPMSPEDEELLDVISWWQQQ